MVDLVGIEPTTSSMPWKRAPSCATGPLYEKKVLLDLTIFAHLRRIVKPCSCPSRRSLIIVKGNKKRIRNQTVTLDSASKAVILMLNIMIVRCDQCGHENNPQYQFCGMCGARLQAPPPPPPRAAQRERAPLPVSGPSFLGLADEPNRDREFHYLLEDEPRGHGLGYVLLLLILAGAAFGTWHFRAELYPLWSPLWARISTSFKPSSGSPPAAQTQEPPPSAEAPGLPHSATVTENEAAPQTTDAGTHNSEAGDQKSTQSSDVQPSKAQSQTADNTPPPKTAADGKNSAEADGDKSTEDEASDNQPSEKASTPAPVRKASKPPPTVPAETGEDRLAAEGERYLYGTGVRQNCDRAQRDLMMAARGSNTKAYTLLGAMYATGHCASRDLPTAYKWFARALHQDPGNARVQRDLEVLWKQMTPDERQIAQRQ
jgi:hypothetical protein